MTCSTSIVHFNFPLNPEINLSSVNKDNYLSSKESSQNIFSNCSKKSEDLSQIDQLSNKNCVQQMIKNQEESYVKLTEQELQSKPNLLDENINSLQTKFNPNMNNGLSNGHDLTLDFDLSGNLITQSISLSSISTSEHSNTSCINPVSSSCSNPNPIVTSNNTMGLLSTHDKDNLSQNLFFKGNKAENGQKMLFNSDTRWSDLKPNLLEKDNILPQLKLNEDKDQTSSTSRPSDDLALSYLIKSESSPESSLNICQNIDSKRIEFKFVNEGMQNVNDSFKSEVCSDDISSQTLNQDFFLSNNLTTDSVPSESICNDLFTEQQLLFKQNLQLMRRIRRLQVQHAHKNLTKQMKVFVSRQQKLNSVSCQRFSLDFSKFIDSSSDNASQLKELLQKDLTFNKIDKIPEPISPYLVSSNLQPNLNHLNCSFGSPNDLNCQKFLPFKPIPHPSNQSQISQTFPQPLKNNLSSLSLQTKASDFSFNNLPPPTTPTNISSFSSDVQSGLNYLNQSRPTKQCNISQKTLSQDNKNKIIATIDTLRYNLRHLETKYDSDATDSSSGGESCDEYDESDIKTSTYLNPTSTHNAQSPPPVKAHIPIRNRSKWKWCSERSAIASRWSWLQAHITDLETKLRQQNDIFRHLRATKGSINFGEENSVQREFPSLSSINTTHSNSTNCNQPTTSTEGNNENITSETEKDCQSIVNEDNVNKEQEVDQEENSCMRTIPFASMKKRKLVRSEHTLSMAKKKTVKYSSVQCSCNIYPSYVPPCVICNGRYSYMHSIDTEFMPYCERVSLLDSSCHPVLCLPNDVSLGLHFMQFLKRETFNNKPVIIRSKKKKSNQSNQITISTDSNTKSKKSIPSKAKKKPEKNKKRRLSTDSVKKSNREHLSSGCSSRAESPVPSPSPSDASSNGASNSTPTPTTVTSAPLNRRRRSEQHAFDINNIVIPYSIAAATRVERLQYKEIITPKWRINEDFSIPPPENVKKAILSNKDSKCEEDISEDAFESRHLKCEENERQRIMSYYVGLTKSKNVRKGTSRVRFESSKSDTVDQSSQDSCSSKVKSKANTDFGYERKRHSISKSLSRDDSIMDEVQEIVLPFELRQFPLPDSVYDIMVQETNQEMEENLCRSRRDSAKNCTDPIDSTEEGTHATNSIVSSPTTTDVDINDDDAIKGHLYRDDDVQCEERDDPEWNPSKD